MVHDNFGVAAEEAAADEEAGADIRIADARLSRIPSLARQALLLTAVEGFSEQETGRIIGRDVDEVHRLLGKATEENDRQPPARIPIIEDETILAMDIALIVPDLCAKVVTVATPHREA